MTAGRPDGKAIKRLPLSLTVNGPMSISPVRQAASRAQGSGELANGDAARRERRRPAPISMEMDRRPRFGEPCIAMAELVDDRADLIDKGCGTPCSIRRLAQDGTMPMDLWRCRGRDAPRAVSDFLNAKVVGISAAPGRQPDGQAGRDLFDWEVGLPCGPRLAPPCGGSALAGSSPPSIRNRSASSSTISAAKECRKSSPQPWKSPAAKVADR